MVVRFPHVDDPDFADVKFDKFTIRLNNVSQTFSNTDDHVTHRVRGGLQIFTIRSSCDIRFKLSLKWMPFDIFDIPLTLIFNEIRTNEVDIFFNVHLSKTITNVLSIKPDAVEENFTPCPLKNTTRLDFEKNKPVDKTDSAFNSSPTLSFSICLSRNPGGLLFSLLFPIYVLDIFILAIYLSDSFDQIASSIANLAAILIALLAYLGNFRA